MSEFGGPTPDVIKKTTNTDPEVKQPPTNLLKTTSMNRRGFLNLAGRVGMGAVATTALGSSASQETHSPVRNADSQQSAEVIKTNEKRLVVDFFDLSSLDKEIEQHLPPEFTSVKDFFRNMGIEDPNSLDGLKKAEPKNATEEKALLLLLLKNRYESHGRTVVDIGRKVSEDLGLMYQEPEKAEASSALQIKDITHDEEGNPVLNLFLSDVDIEKIIEKTEARDIGLSLEMGEFSITYKMYDTQRVDPLALIKPKPSTHSVITKDPSGKKMETEVYYDAQHNKITKEEYDKAMKELDATKKVLLEPKSREMIIKDGYLHENAYDNLIRMVNLAEKFPDKNFVVASGNPRFTSKSRPDIREARAQILSEKKNWPKNLKIVGVKGQLSGVDYAASLGCDIYVDESYLEKIGMPAASSYATPVVKELVSILADKGLDRQKIDAALTLMSDNIRSQDDPINVVSIDKTKALMHFIQ